jgi:monothiol glutaredoxin
MALDDEIRARIAKTIGSDRVVLFMKGTRGFPQCGFSARVVQMLDRLVPEYTTVDVLADPEIRQGIKEFSSWPTIPQLYVASEFIGGCDIITEMFQSGELQTLMREKVAQ